jgi:predicted transposase YbfD/YdcC
MAPEPEYTQLMARVASVPDPRGRQGRQYPWTFLLAILCGALVSGLKTVRGIAQWAQEHRDELLTHLPARPKHWRVPSPATLSRTLRTVDISALEREVADYGQAVAQADPAAGRVPGVNGEALVGQACDGKTLRGSQANEGRTHLVSLVQHGSGVTLAQQATTGQGQEMAAVRALLAGRDLQGVVLTLDALHTQRPLLQQIRDQAGDYLVVAKDNQPELRAAIALLFEGSPPPRLEDDRRSARQLTYRGHSRVETRTLVTSSELNDYLAPDWPGVQQVFQRRCRRLDKRTGQVSTALEYGLTSLSRQRAGPAQIAALRQGHWTIENRSHYVRDETLGEDRCRVRYGSGPQGLAALRNGVLALLRQAGWENIAAALRHYGASVERALRLIGAVSS